jgi:hypothetical protein
MISSFQHTHHRSAFTQSPSRTRFQGQVQSAVAPQFGSNPAPQTTPSTKQPVDWQYRAQGAWQGFKNSAFSPKWWAMEGAIAGAITLATCWLPGSQLLTIPAWIGASLAINTIMGGVYPEKALEAAQKKRQNGTEPHNHQHQEWTTSEKAKGAFKGAMNGLKTGFIDHWKTKLALGAGLSIALCWLPGSQLFVIPAIYCVSAAFKATSGTLKGYQQPAKYGVKPSNQSGETEAK